ncbi:DUF475 domain-containing protein [Schumannella sp. 10F1B-5-1]|uniref:DUF475 domain-containing protein n=1 Tax=Schumannella sp. 10F1B-5-1 TaxID=2590780 RepID=UPI0015E860BC|nr:DUF475 domain-containing protein [Schumannella sp. 10F1B-5-1]
MRAFRHIVLLPALLLAAAATAAGLWLGWPVALALLALTALEIAAGADSSVPMAGVASRIDQRARRLFLSLGLVVGVIVMRLLLPPLSVATADGAAAGDVLVEAVAQPAEFNAHLVEVRPFIAAFGAAFVWLVFAEYLFNTDRAPRRAWMGRAEALLARTPQPRILAVATALIGTVATGLAAGPELAWTVLAGGTLGMGGYALSQAIAHQARRRSSALSVHVHAATVIFERALVIFLVFEILDGVPALSSTPLLSAPVLQAIVAGTAVVLGAVFLSRLTSGVVSADGLSRLRFLKSGAAYVLGVLSVLLWVSLVVPVPAAVATWFGSAIIAAALISSLRPRIRMRALRVAHVTSRSRS